MGRLTHWLLYLWYIDNICVRCPVIHMCIGYTVRNMVCFIRIYRLPLADC